MKDLTLLGDNKAKFNGLETFPAPPGISHVEYVSNEVTALCPVTGQPDWYTVEIMLITPQLCIESKSLKLYLQSFRQDGRFCEAFASLISADIKLVTGGKVRVVVTQKPRGGVEIRAEVNI